MAQVFCTETQVGLLVSARWMSVAARIALVIAVALATAPALACPIEPIHVVPSSGRTPVTVPSNPRLFVVGEVSLEVLANGEAVPYRISPTIAPAIRQLDISIDSGLFEIRAHSGLGYTHDTYRVQPSAVPVRTAQTHGNEYGVWIKSEAAMYRFEWSDGTSRLELWGYLDPDERQPARVIGLFTDGSEAVVFESAEQPVRCPELVAVALLALMALLGRTISRGVAVGVRAL